MRGEGEGGVGSITFDKDGNPIDYRMILEGTSMNCGGGLTPWNTWVSCEEKHDRYGNAFQVDPLGARPAERMTMGSYGGRWESFAYEDRAGFTPHFYMTEDHPRGALLRFIPTVIDWDDPWRMLHGQGTRDYLKLNGDGTFAWTINHTDAMENARQRYPDTEGIDVGGSELLFVSKSQKTLYTLDLDANTWEQASTQSGLLDGQPDQLQRIIKSPRDLLYFTEEGGRSAGIHACDEEARFYTIMDSASYPGETSGLALSPDARFMFVAYQDVGKVFCIWRMDRGIFGAEHLDIKFHEIKQ